MKSLSQKEILRLRPAQAARELQSIATDFPALELLWIDKDGQAVSKASPHTIITLFRDKTWPISDVMAKIKDSVAAVINYKPDEDIAEAEKNDRWLFNFFSNCAFAEALMQRAQQRGIKPHIWGQNAAHLLEFLNNTPDAPSDLKKGAYVTALSWFTNTIAAGQDGLNAALDGLGHLMYAHHPENEPDAVEKSIVLFTQAATNGYLPSMNTLADLVNTEGALTPDEHSAAVAAIHAGAKKTPDGSGIILQKLAQGGASGSGFSPLEAGL